MTVLGKLNETEFPLRSTPSYCLCPQMSLGYEFRPDHCSYYKILKCLCKHSPILWSWNRYIEYQLRKNFYLLKHFYWWEITDEILILAVFLVTLYQLALGSFQCLWFFFFLPAMEKSIQDFNDTFYLWR